MSVQVSYKKQFTLGIIFLIIIFASFEGIARGYEFFIIPCRPSVSDAYEDMNYLLVRQICTDIRYLQFEEPTVIQNKPNQAFSTISINNYGFRGLETTVEKSEDVFRIIMIGGSTLFGHGSSSNETTIPGYLQDIINKNQKSKNIEVINAGVNSLYSFTETYHIKNSLIKFNPDIIINYGGWNDADYFEEDPKINSLEEDTQFKFKNYPFYRTPFVIFTLLFSEQYKEEAFDKVYNQRDNFPEKVIPVWKERWLEVCNLGNENNFSTIIAVQPMIHTGNKPMTDYERKFFTQTIHDNNVKINFNGFVESFNELDNICQKTIDLRNVFDTTEKAIYWDKGHMTDLGNKIIAEKLYEEISPLLK
jgi:lysophospholipase L1-like esterase